MSRQNTTEPKKLCDKKTKTSVHYDWALLSNRDIRERYVLALRNKLDVQQEKTETHTPNDEYGNFVNVHLELANTCIKEQTEKIVRSIRFQTFFVQAFKFVVDS